MKLHKRVLKDLMVTPGEGADFAGWSTTATKSDCLDSKHGPSPKDLAKGDLESSKRSTPPAKTGPSNTSPRASTPKAEVRHLDRGPDVATR